MDRTQFGFLLLHAGALPRLAMQQMLEEITATMAGEGALDETAFASQEAAARADLERAADRFEADPTLLPPMHVDFSAGQSLTDEERSRLRDDADQALADELAQAQALRPHGSADDMPDGPLDLGAFLARAYAQPLPAARVDAAFGRADHAAIDAALARLPAGLPPLAAALDADAMGQWLALFRTEDANLEALVEAVVRSEEPA